MSAASSFVADFCALAQTKGLDVEGLLARAGIAPAVILNPGGRVPNEHLAALAVCVWDELGWAMKVWGSRRDLSPEGRFT